LDETTWDWIGSALRIPVLDNYWQTETGWPVLALLPGLEAPQIRPGSPGIALFGYDAKIVDPATGETLPRGEKGVLAIGLPCLLAVCRRFGRMTHYLSTIIAVDSRANSSIRRSITRFRMKKATFSFWAFRRRDQC
jgi:acyl-coenzyme A synthetase/AMP-(fatty) acid ligase